MKIGERIRQRRKEIGPSVDELAEILGKNRATVYRYESNEIEKLPTTVLEPLAKALKTTPAYLMGWEDESTVKKGHNEESDIIILNRKAKDLSPEKLRLLIKMAEAMMEEESDE